MSEFQVDPAGLRSHAGHLGEVSSGVALAVDASGQSSISDGSLGMMIGPLVVGALGVAEALARSALQSAGESVDRLADELTGMAADFGASDGDVSAAFDATATGESGPVAPGVRSSSSGGGNPRISPALISRMGPV